MNLLCKNNLLDVTSIYDSRKNLCMGSIVHQCSNDIYITGGTIDVDVLYINYYDRSYDRALTCDSQGNVSLDHDTFPFWLTTSISNTNPSSFCNDINIVFIEDLHPVSFYSDYRMITTTNVSFYDFYDSEKLNIFADTIPDALFSKLHLNKYAKCNLTEDMSFDSVSVSNLKLLYLPSGYLVSDGNVHSFPHVLYEDYSFLLLKDNPDSNDAVTSKYLSIYWNDLYTKYSLKNTNFNETVRSVTNYLIDNQDIFVDASSNLSDVDIDIVQSKLELTKLFDNIQLYYDTENLLCLEVSNDTTFRFFRNRSKLTVESFQNEIIDKYQLSSDTGEHYFLYLDTYNKYQYIHSTEFSRSSDVIEGILKCHDNFDIVDNSNTFTLRFFHNVYINHRSNLESVGTYGDFQRFLEELYATGTDTGSNMLRFSCNLEEISEFPYERQKLCYSNLGLHPIVSNSNYYILINTPKTLDSFCNNMMFMLAHNNLIELEDKHTARSNLQLGTLATQDIDNIDITGSNLNIQHLKIHGNFSLHDNINTYKHVYSSNNNGDVSFEFLPEATSNSYGIVYLHNTLIYDEEAAYTTRLLHDVYEKFKNDLSNLQAELVN